MANNNGCGCDDNCNSLAGTSSFVYLASSDDSSGGGFTYPMNPAQRYWGIISSPNNFTPVASNFAGLWNDKGVTQGNTQSIGSSTPASLTSSNSAYTTLLTITIAVTGNYIANASAWYGETGGVATAIIIGIEQNSSFVTNGARNSTVAANGNIEIACNTLKFAATAGDTIKLLGRIPSPSGGAAVSFESGNLVVQQVL